MLPNPYVILAAIGIWLGSAIGIWIYKGHIDSLAYTAAIAKQNATAATLLSKLEAANAAKEAADSDFAQQLQQAKSDADKKNAADADSARADFDDKLRRIAATRPSCPSTGTAEALNAARLADSARQRQDQLLAGIAERLSRLGTSANELATIVSAECVPFANRYGR